MDYSSFTQNTCQSKPSTDGKKKRSWKTAEEHHLITALKDIVAGGWKADNGFKMGYLTALEGAMAAAFPGTDLKGEPHIHSKITVWKKHYGIVSTMLDRSGFGWNDTLKTIDVPDDQVWEQYVLAFPKCKGMRYKRWPFYNDWVMIFGKDRATGSVAKDWYNAVNGVVHPNNDKNDSATFGAANFGAESFATDPQENNSPPVEDHDNISTSTGQTNTSCASKQGNKRKRPASRFTPPVNEDPKMVELMSSFFNLVHAQIGTLVSKVGHDHDVSEMRKNLFKALEPISHLSVDQKLDVQKLICSNAQWVDIFYGLSPENQLVMVNRIVEKKW